MTVPDHVKTRLCVLLAGSFVIQSALNSQVPNSSAVRTDTPVENSFVKVLQFTIGPGTFSPSLSADSKTQAEEAGPNIVLTLQAKRAPKTLEETIDAAEWILKDVHFEPDNMNRHYPGVRALSGRYVRVSILSQPPMSRFKSDATTTDARHNKILFENQFARVVSVHFGPGESGPIVDKRPRVIILLDDMHAIVTLPDGHSEPRDGKAGTVYWGNAGAQATKNIGDKPFENIVVELKGK